jgi:hypothetical protein
MLTLLTYADSIPGTRGRSRSTPRCGSPNSPPAVPPPPAGLQLPNDVAGLVNFIRDNPDNADTLKMAIGRLALLIRPLGNPHYLQNVTASLNANAPEILVTALNTITNDNQLDAIGCRCLNIISMQARGKMACFRANAAQLLVRVIERNTNNYNIPISFDAIKNAILTLKSMVTNKDPFEVKPEHINALRNAGVAAALIKAKGIDIELNKNNYITTLLGILEYDDNGNNIRPVAQPPQRTAFQRFAGFFGRGGRRKTVKRKSNSKKNSRASRRIMQNNRRVTMRRR